MNPMDEHTRIGDSSIRTWYVAEFIRGLRGQRAQNREPNLLSQRCQPRKFRANRVGSAQSLTMNTKRVSGSVGGSDAIGGVVAVIHER